MNHQWSFSEFNFQTHQNQQSFYLPYHECLDSPKYSTKAYVNPHIANYEHIKRSLTKTPSLGNNKIHVNPNFKGKQEEYNLNFNNLVFTNNSSSKPYDLSKPGTSGYDKKANSKTFSADSEVTLLKSRFKKVNKLNPTKPKYSWCKNENSNELSKPSNILLLKSKNCKKAVPVLGENKYKFVASKKFKFQTPEKTPRIYLSKTKIINKSKTKLINNNTKMNRKIIKVYSPIKAPFCIFENKSKKSIILKVAKAVANKYKYYNNAKQSKNFKYKIDKRNKAETIKRGSLSGIPDISKLFPSNFHTRLKSSQQSYDSTTCKNLSLQRKNQVTQQGNPIIAKKFPNRRVVKIGGILYKTTTNKLTLAKNKEPKKQSQTKSKNHVVYVRGEKFLLENNGKTLRRQPQNLPGEKNLLQALRRIDIGGVTYVQKSKNVLVRTNVHHTQYLVNKAKNKSIAILTNLRKRSTMPCMIYHRFGKCNRHNKGLCMYKHDPKNIAICKMFLKGNCKNNNCLLSHQAIPEKMATCHFFLNGFCDRENCPFPHVKLNKNVAICEKFLQGFCNLGKECSKRHLHVCPNFDKFGICSLGYKCHYPHKVVNKKNQSSSENMNISNKSNDKVQYFISSDVQKNKGKLRKCLAKKENKKGTRKKLKLESLSTGNSDRANDTIKCVPKRIKLEELPCFIPLQNDS